MSMPATPSNSPALRATEIKAIPTRYAGCHFRSRLEARWAVFLDTLGVEWEYEAQGYETNGGRYLPDFWIPDWRLFVEVKGAFSHPDFVKVTSAVPQLIERVDGQVQPTLLILGPVPRPGAAWTHVRLDMFRDCLLFQQVFFDGSNWFPKPINQAVALGNGWRPDVTKEDTEWFRSAWLESVQDPRITVDPNVDAAYTAARSARFEFEQSG